MDYSPFLAKFLGLYFVIVALAVIWNKDRMPELVKNYLSNPAIIMESGLVALLFGLFLLLIHNVWEANGSVLVTIVAYLALMKGIVRLFFQDLIEKFAQYFTKPEHFLYAGLGTFAYGVLLLMYAYGIFLA